MATSERYAGNPMLIVLENYALAVIGELMPEKATGVREVVQRAWGGDDDWMATVRGELQWNDAFDGTIRQNWHEYQQAAREQEVSGSAVEFAMLFADAIQESAR
jgi:hypothetical protein